MNDLSVPNPDRWTPSRRLRVVTATLVGLIGFSAAALLNQAVARFAALPESTKPAEYTTVEGIEPERALPSPSVNVPSLIGTPEGVAPVRSSGSTVRRRPSSETTYSDAIVRRNIFDSTAVYNPKAVTAGGGECRSDSAVRLVATVVGEQPDHSSALISAGARGGASAGYVIGDDVAGEGRIVSIEQKRVCLEGGTCLCMGGEAGPLAPLAQADDPSGIAKLADNHFVVDKSVLDDALNNFEALATQVKVYPHKNSDGDVDGYRLSSIRANSQFSKLGIKNGDIVHGVNGQPLNSTESAMAAFQALKNGSNFSFDITRKNQKQTLEFEVR